MERFAWLTDENGLFDASGHDLTLIVVIDRRVDLSLSQGRGYWVDFCSLRARHQASPLQGTSYPSVASGRRERGFVTNSFLIALSWMFPCGDYTRGYKTSEVSQTSEVWIMANQCLASSSFSSGI